MKTELLLMLLLCGACFSCNSPQQDKQESDLIKVNKKMTNEQLREKLGLALEDMKAKAIEMGIEVWQQPRFLTMAIQWTGSVR